jgi:inhibitor of cysteine peptidase
MIIHLILIIGVGLLCACSAKSSPVPSTRKLSETDLGRSIELRTGEMLEITLPGNPTTGFQWEIAAQDTAILQPTGEVEYVPSDSAVGGAGRFIFRFTAIRNGRVNLKLNYTQPFEKGQPPAQTFEVSIIVK